jgi:hypothetical protein
MNRQAYAIAGYQALVINRSTGDFATHHLNSEDHELANEWARCLAQSCRVELWHNAQLVGSFPPLSSRAAKQFS